MLPTLDARLTAAAQLVRPGQPVADIGCDHGKLTAGSGRCPLVLACDLRPGPLEKARVTCAPYGDKVQCRLGSGLSVLEPGEADDIIIAGMGAETIIEILEAAPWVFDARYNLVLVPATKHSILRRWLGPPRLCTAGRDPLPSRRPVVRRHERAVHGCRPRAGRAVLPDRPDERPARVQRVLRRAE